MVVDRAGPPCPCGRRGCWERYASGAGLGLLAREAALAGRLDEVVRARRRRSRVGPRRGRVGRGGRGRPGGAVRSSKKSGGGSASASPTWPACSTPQCFVLGGGVVQAGDLLIEAARATFAALVEGAERRPLAVVVPAAFGERAGAVGAALGGAPGRARLMTAPARAPRRCAPASCSRRSATRPTPRSRPLTRRWPPVSTGSSVTTTSGPSASPSARRSRPSRSSARSATRFPRRR